MTINLCSHCSFSTTQTPSKNCDLCLNFFDNKSIIFNKIKQELAKINQKNFKTFSSSIIMGNRYALLEDELFRIYGPFKSVKARINKQVIDFVESLGFSFKSKHMDFKIEINLLNNTIKIIEQPSYIFGHYLKFSQMMQVSYDSSPSVKKEIESIIKSNSKTMLNFHASGREDFDVMMLNTGRPFVIKIKERQISPISNFSTSIKIKDLRWVEKEYINMVTDSAFDKQYIAIVECDKSFTKQDIEKLSILNGIVINQRTPSRVKFSRAILNRKRQIRKIKVLSINKNILIADILVQSGTYIKELISGDNGRTTPSFSSILSKNCVCKKLSVIKIYDEYLNYFGEKYVRSSSN